MSLLLKAIVHKCVLFCIQTKDINTRTYVELWHLATGKYLNQALQPKAAHTWFLEIALVRTSVCVCVCLCVRPRGH